MLLSDFAGGLNFALFMAICSLLPWTSAAAQAQEPAAARTTAKASEAESAQRLERMVRTAAEYEVTARDGSKGAIELREKPLLRWSNPLRETDDGALFLWTDAGRPVIAACVYNVGEGVIEHELQSLATGPLRATRRNSQVWIPATPGIEFKSIPESAAAPAATPSRRLTQMRNILRGFSGGLGRDRWRHELRLMPQPLYRYDSDEAGVVDGALFAFAQGTDPEILLLLEARRSDEQSLSWQYAVARMNMSELDLKHAGKIVWRVGDWDRRVDPRQPYITFAFRR